MDMIKKLKNNLLNVFYQLETKLYWNIFQNVIK